MSQTQTDHEEILASTSSVRRGRPANIPQEEIESVTLGSVFNAPVEMISLRNLRLATLGGHILQFEAKVPRMVPSSAVQEAMNKGCVPTSEDDAPFYDDLAKSKAEFTGDLRRSVVLLAIDVLVRENSSKNFSGGGVPKIDVINDRVGFDVTKKELISLYQEFSSIRQSGGELQVHPQARLVQQIVEATTRGELIALLPQAGIPPKAAAGVTVRDLRKLMLAKFSGLSAT